jgi:DNA-binding CsgD family transcriptional regulator
VTEQTTPSQSRADRTLGKQMPRLLRFIAAWTAALQGQGDLETASRSLLAIFPAKSLRIKRLSITKQPRRIVVLGDHNDFPSLTLTDVTQSMGHVSQEHAILRIVLARSLDQADTIELALHSALKDVEIDLLPTLGAAMAESWLLRRPGLIERCLFEQNNRKGAANPDTDSLSLLHYTNPYNLSRSEFRVCALIGQGLTAKHIAKELNLSEATIRSHQRAIYAKTDLGGQMEVMFHMQKFANSNWAVSGQIFAERA